MGIIVGILGLAAGVGLLYFWLTAHWFGRVLVFLAIAVLSIVAGVVMSHSKETPGWVYILIGWAAAWPVASLPIWMTQKKAAPEPAPGEDTKFVIPYPGER